MVWHIKEHALDTRTTYYIGTAREKKKQVFRVHKKDGDTSAMINEW